jgi:peptide/nickel transport system permease protein
LKQYVPATIELALSALVFALLVGLPLGVVAARWRNGWPDHLGRFISLIGSSLPIFWLALIMLYIFYSRLRWLPGPGRLDASLNPPATITGLYTVDSLLERNWADLKNALEHLVLPALVLGWANMGIISRMTRSSLLEVLRMDYVRTARAKGVKERVVVYRHALRNALIPVTSVVGIAFGGLLAGAVITETIFAWPGLGYYAVGASELLDFPAIIGVTLLISATYITLNLVVDILYGVLDPRIREA